MATYYSIPLEEMDDVLRGFRFAPVELTYRNRPVKEWVYERRLPRSPNHFVRVYTGVQRYGRGAGRSRKVGKDAIRVQVVYRDEKGETLVSQTKRVHRVEGWRENLQKRMNEISSTLPQVEFDTRGEPMTLRKYKGNYFWGSRDYPQYKETKSFALEEITCDEYFKVTAEDLEDSIDRCIRRLSNPIIESSEEFRILLNTIERSYLGELWGAEREVTKMTTTLEHYQNVVDNFCIDYPIESFEVTNMNELKEEILDYTTRRLSIPLYFRIDFNNITLTQYDRDGDDCDTGALTSESWIIITNGFGLPGVAGHGMWSMISHWDGEEEDGYTWQIDEIGNIEATYLGEGRPAFSAPSDEMDERLNEIYPENFFENIFWGGSNQPQFLQWKFFFEAFANRDATFLPFPLFMGFWIDGDDEIDTDLDNWEEINRNIEISQEGSWNEGLPDFMTDIQISDEAEEVILELAAESYPKRFALEEEWVDEYAELSPRMVIRALQQISGSQQYSISLNTMVLDMASIPGMTGFQPQLDNQGQPRQSSVQGVIESPTLERYIQNNPSMGQLNDIDAEGILTRTPHTYTWSPTEWSREDGTSTIVQHNTLLDNIQSLFDQYLMDIPVTSRPTPWSKQSIELAFETSLIQQSTIKKSVINMENALFNEFSCTITDPEGGDFDCDPTSNFYLLPSITVTIYHNDLGTIQESLEITAVKAVSDYLGVWRESIASGRNWTQTGGLDLLDYDNITIESSEILGTGWTRTPAPTDAQSPEDWLNLWIAPLNIPSVTNYNKERLIPVVDIRHRDRPLVNQTVEDWLNWEDRELEGSPQIVDGGIIVYYRAESPDDEIDAEEEIELDIIDIDTPEEAYNLLYGWNKKPSLARLPNKGKSFFRFTFEGAISLRTIGGPSKVLMGTNLLQSKHKRRGMQVRISKAVEKQLELNKILGYLDGRDVLSAWMPIIPTENANQKELLSELSKGYSGTTLWNTPRLQKNQIIFDMKDVVFGLDLDPAGVPINWVKNIKLEKTGYYPQKESSKFTGAEIEIIGGVPTKNILYQTLPEDLDTRFWAYDDYQRSYYRNRLSDPELSRQEPVSTDFEWWNFRDLLMIPKRKEEINKLPYPMEELEEIYQWALAAEEITLKEFDDTGIGTNHAFKDMDDKITFMLRKFSKINRHGDIGCPGCGSIGLFYSEPITKGRKWHCLSCLYEDKIESIKSRGDITLEKYGLLIECPLCEKPIKAYNQDSINRHMRKCKEESS